MTLCKRSGPSLQFLAGSVWLCKNKREEPQNSTSQVVKLQITTPLIIGGRRVGTASKLSAPLALRPLTLRPLTLRPLAIAPLPILIPILPFGIRPPLVLLVVLL